MSVASSDIFVERVPTSEVINVYRPFRRKFHMLSSYIHIGGPGDLFNRGSRFHEANKSWTGYACSFWTSIQDSYIAGNAAFLPNNDTRVKFMRFRLDDLDALLRLFILLKATYLLASYQTARIYRGMEGSAGSRSVSTPTHDEARCHLCGTRFLGSRRHCILNVRRHMKTAHESGVKAAFIPHECRTRYMQADLERLLLQNEHLPTTVRKISGTAAVDLDGIDESLLPLSAFKYIAQTRKGPNLWNILHQINFDRLLQGFIMSAASFTKAATKAANSTEWILMAWSRLVVSLQPKLQPGMTRIRWKCVSMSLVSDGAFKGSNANLSVMSSAVEATYTMTSLNFGMAQRRSSKIT